MTKQLELPAELPRTRLDLPPGWVWTKIGEIGAVQLGRQRSPENHHGSHMRPYLRVANVFENRIDTRDVMEMNFDPAEYERFRLEAGDVLLNEGQSRELVGRPAIYRDEVPGACFQNTLVRFRACRGVLPEFALIVFRAYLHDGTFRSIARWTTNLAHLGADRFASLDFPLAPCKEQQHIVDVCAELESKLDVAINGLKRVQANLARYRATVLKAAMEGRLVPTEAELAGQEGRDYEPASSLLKRILAERRRRWEEAELARMQARGRPPKDDKWKTNYPEPAVPDIASLPTLPQGWCWATWEQIGFSQNGRSFPSSEYCSDGVALLRPGNLHKSGRVEWNSLNTERMPAHWAAQFPAFVVRGDELVMNLTAQSLKDEFLGRVCITGAADVCLLNQRIARLTPVLVNPRYLLWMFKSPVFRRFVDGLNKGSLIQHMFTSQLAAFKIPLPPLAEQERIVADVDRLFSVEERRESVLLDAVVRARRLRQGILRWAVEGKLVDRDTSDAPASVLLARIHADREIAATTARGTRPGRVARKPVAKAAKRTTPAKKANKP